MSQIADLEKDLSHSWRNLQSEWAEVREEWSDKVAENFERKWWNELEHEIPQLIESVSQLDESFRQVQTFLSD
jgi:hypothetical protein